jgi:hypothetical protein
VSNIVFAVVSFLGGAYFILHRRIGDLFVVAFGGCVFYFLPLLFGYVPARTEPPSDVLVQLPYGIYPIGVGITASVLLAAIVFDCNQSSMNKSEIDTRDGTGLSSWYLLFAVIGFIGSIKSGTIFNLDKTSVLEQVGYWFVLFEISAALAVIDAFWHRMRWQFATALAFLAIDLIIGFRVMTVMVFIACVLLTFGSYGQINLWKKLPALGLCVVVLFLAMVTVNPFRYAILPHLQLFQEASNSPGGGIEERVQLSQSLRLGTSPSSNVDVDKTPADASQATKSETKKQKAKAALPVDTTPLSERLKGIVKSIPDFQNIEPFVTQAILAEMVRNDFSCSPRNILNAVYVVPFAGLLFGAPKPFESEFKNTLFPDYKYGLAGNIWAEAFCRFGYIGIACAVLIFVALLAGTQILLSRDFTTAIPALALCGAFLAFYVHRNDLLFELLLIRRTLMVFVAAWMLRYLWSIFFTVRRSAKVTP